MRHPQIDDQVRLKQDIPELSLQQGQIGVVRSTWFSPTVAYEVEFATDTNSCGTRALLLERQVAIDGEIEAVEPMFDQNVDMQPPL